MLYNAGYGFEGITHEELKTKMRSGDDFLLLDVRTPLENAAETIEGSYLIPIHELPARIDEIPKDRDIVVYCRIGTRSAYACMYLARLGYRVMNLDGGIRGWKLQKDLSLQRTSS
jgi:rhodanese-related sulfurtransferase